MENARLLRAIRQAVHDLSTAIAEILAATAQQSAGASEQSAAITPTSTTIDEVRAIADQTAQRAQSVAAIAQHTAEVSRSGQEAVAETSAGMQEIKLKVECIATTILALSEQAQAIGQIIATVSQIAAQSNILALNAAVEAARAGKAGRGFAVVAEEVRALAEQSQDATVRIRNILTEMQRGVNAAVMATAEGMKGTDAGTSLTSRASEAIQQLTASVQESVQAALQIAAAAGQTPIQYSWDRRDRLSVISATTIAPQRRRLGLYFQIYEANIRFEQVIAFLTRLHRQLRRKFIVVLDRLNAHRKGIRLLQAAHPDWFEVEWLPPYAPDLNPVEMVWNHTKYGDLANFVPDDIHHLHLAVTNSLSSARSQSELLRSFFRRPRLDL